MNNPWKLATLALVLTGVTAVSTGVTTAYMMRSSEGAGSRAHATPAPASAFTSAPAADLAPMNTAAPPLATPAVIRPAVATHQTPVVHTRADAPAPVQRTAVVTPVATDCSTGGQRAMKIAKPGIIATLAGAGLGAVGGAITDGGSGAGKGALIGGIAGAALGTGYGAYKTKQECGTIFGSTTLGF
jgi:hypothetical protein